MELLSSISQQENTGCGGSVRCTCESIKCIMLLEMLSITFSWIFRFLLLQVVTTDSGRWETLMRVLCSRLIVAGRLGVMVAINILKISIKPMDNKS